MRALLDTPVDRHLIYDVGLHLGEDTDFYLRKGFRVVAFEASASLARRCRRRFTSYLSSGQLTIIEGAIVDRHTLDSGQVTVPFYVTASTLAGSVSSDWDPGGNCTDPQIRQDVVAIDFAEALKTHGIPYYLKVDIEGTDVVCLQALNRFRNRPTYVSLESSRKSFEAIRSEIHLLASLGYDAFQAIEQSGLRSSQLPPLPAREGHYVDTVFESGSSGLFGTELEEPWMSSTEVLRQYRFIWLGYVLLGNRGILYRLPTRVGSAVREGMKKFLKRATRGNVPGWYDTHARHISRATR